MPCRLLILSALIFGAIPSAGGAPLLVETVSYTALGEPAATHIYLVDWNRRRVVPGGPNYYGAEPAGAPFVLPGRDVAVLPLWRFDPLRTVQSPVWETAAVHIVPPRRMAWSGSSVFDSAQSEWARMLPASVSDGPALWSAPHTLSPDRTRVRRQRFQRFDKAVAGVLPGGDITVTGRPVDAVRVAKDETVLLSKMPEYFVLTRIRPGMKDSLAAEREARLAVPAGAGNFVPKLLAASSDGRWLYVIGEGSEPGSAGESASWIYLVDARSLQVAGVPLRLDGVPVKRGLLPQGRDSCWAVTELLQPRSRVVTKVAAASQGLTVRASRSFSTVDAPLPARSPDEQNILVGNGPQLFEANARGEWALEKRFDAHIGGLSWTAEGVFVGEGNRLHRLGGEGQSERFISLPRGRIQYIVPIPNAAGIADDHDWDGLSTEEEMEMSTFADNPDSDRDGIPDGLDLRPVQPSRRFPSQDRERISVSLAGRGDAVFALGEHLQLSRVEPVEPGAAWPQWLRIQEVYASGVSALRVSAVDVPDAPASDAVLSAKLLVHARDIYSNQWLQDDGVPLTVDWERSNSRPREILWVLPEGAARTVRLGTDGRMPLADTLAAPPHYFSHRHATGPVDRLQTEHAVIVADVATAARGTLTRQLLTDFVRAGGGLLLILASDVEDSERELVRFWLKAFGADCVSAPRELTVTEHRLTRYWPEHRRSGGQVFRLDAMGKPIVADAEGSGACVLGLRLLGLGRVVLLAEPQILWDGSAQGNSASRFATKLFEFLATRDFGSKDADGDGLANALEDANGSGAWEPGETDFLRADSDNDGVPDGLEDWNGNGRWDEGETHPLNPDSDDDGTPDGADRTPLPQVGTPVISAVSPAEGPAEGGLLIEVRGQNIPPNGRLFFGATPAVRAAPPERSRMQAYVPGLRRGLPVGPVDVRLQVGPEVVATLPDGYTYTARSRGELRWAELRAIARVYDGYTGRVALHLDALGSDITNAEVWIVAEPGGVVKAAEWRASAALRQMGGSVLVDFVTPSIYRMELAGLRPRDSGLPLVFFDYRANFDESFSDRLRLAVRQVRATTSFGGELDVSLPVLDLPLADAAPLPQEDEAPRAP